MKKKILSAVMVLAMVLSLLPVTALAANEAVAKVTTTKGDSLELYTAQEITDFINGTDNNEKFWGGTVQLLKDITLPLQDSGVGILINYQIAPTLDLGGNTLTFTDKDVTFTSLSSIVISGIMINGDGSTPVTIKNGTIVMEITDPQEGMLYYPITTMFNTIEIENVEVKAESGTTGGIMVASGNNSDKLILRNCVVNAGENQAITSFTEPSNNKNIEIVSGSYKNLNKEIVSFPEDHKEITVTGVDSDTTVIASSATTAIIVDDGNAYLYDTLQDAVEAVKNGETIQLLKQPEDTSVEIPTDASFTVAAFGDENIDITKIPFTTEEGHEVIVGENGAVSVEKTEIPVESITLDTDKLTLYTNTTPNTATITATLTPSDATDTVKWSSNNTDVATVDQNGKVTAVGDGQTTITAAAGEVSATCAVTVTTYVAPTPSTPSYSDDNDDGYSVSVPASSSIRGGSITVSPRSADKGDEVTITLKPDQGYELDRLTVTDGRGEELELSWESDNRCTFTMPSSRVDIQVSFRPIETAPVNPFVDVNTGDYYYDAVLWALDNGVTSGTSAATFSPNAVCTRAQMMTYLWRAAGSPRASAANPFADVDTGDYYYDAVLWAVEKASPAAPAPPPSPPTPPSPGASP